MKDRRVLLGSIFIIIGVFFILDILNYIPWYWDDILFSWETFLIILGLIIVTSSKHKIIGFILMGIGAYWLIDDIFHLTYQQQRLIWPILLVLLGVYIIFRSKIGGGDDPDSPDGSGGSGEDMDYIDEVSVFGGGDKTISSNNFKGGKITSIFGGCELNLKNAKLGEGRKVIDVFAIFGGAKLIVPEDWNVRVEVFPLFGGFSDKRKLDPNVIPDPRKEIFIKGIVIFGGGEIKNF
ncbi:LiaF-related protein [Fulvivirgaceae bacterium BMA10]|uniref:LiaF-related protein n=1 Tax=Splendidivirga corallicola TaxID=3051826 RepID=A0ABT8KQP0_9BACT|nr:LiaF-related protein [Fulvivirgaceae bacterium BMA10]